MEGLVSAFLFKDKYIIHSNSKTENWLWIASEPFYILPLDVNVSVFAEKIFDALNNCKFDIPHPKQSEWTNINKEYVKSMGFKSNSLMRKNISFCTLTYSGEEVSIDVNEKSGNNAFEVVKEITVKKNDEGFNFENIAKVVMTELQENFK